MTSHQESRLTSAGKIRQFFEDNKFIWQGNKLILESMDKLDNFFVEIGKDLDLQKTPISGFAKDKKKFRDNCDIITDVYYGMFRALATKTEDNTLYEKYKAPLSEIQKILDNEMPFVIQDAQKFADDNKDILKDYGYTNELAEKYGKEARGYINYVNKPEEGKGIRAAATERMAGTFSDMSTFFKKELDNEMKQYKITQSVFYQEYIKMRNIYDNPSHKTSLLGLIENEDTGKPESGVKVTASFKAQHDLANIVKISSDKGNYSFPKLEPGIWIITYQKFGFDTITIELEIVKGKSTRRNIKIRPTE